MRRLIVPSSLLFLVASLCVVAMLSPAGAVGRARRSSARSSATAGMIVPCCPTPSRTAPDRAAASTALLPAGQRLLRAVGTLLHDDCCTTTAARPACCTTPCTSGALTIAASPDPSTAGRKVVISGGLTSNPPPSGVQVVLWRELSGQSTFHQVTQTTTDSAGQYKITLTRGMVNADQKWYVTANGLQSPTLQQQVNALIGLAGLHTVSAGQAMLLRGQVTPSHAGQVVLIEQRRGGHWAVIARPRLGHNSKYGIMHRFARAGTVELRTVLPGDARNNRSNSATLTVTVKLAVPPRVAKGPETPVTSGGPPTVCGVRIPVPETQCHSASSNLRTPSA